MACRSAASLRAWRPVDADDVALALVTDLFDLQWRRLARVGAFRIHLAVSAGAGEHLGFDLLYLAHPAAQDVGDVVFLKPLERLRR